MITPGTDPIRILGADPGPTTGFAMLYYTGIHRRLIEIEVAQSSAGLAPMILRAMLTNSAGIRTFLGVEKFVIGNRTSRTGEPASGITRQLVTELTDVFEDWRIRTEPLAPGQTEFRDHLVFVRPAAQIKPWATDERLDAAGLLNKTKGMVHARDAVRHALYTASRDAKIRDPLATTTGRAS